MRLYVGAQTQAWDCVFAGCTFHIMSDGHRVRLGSKKPLKICLLQLSVQCTTPENYYLWLHSGGGACVPVVGVCCIMWMRVKQEGGGRRSFSLWRWEFLSIPTKTPKRTFLSSSVKVCRHRAKPGPQRRRVEGKAEVKLRGRKATPERRMSETSHGLFIIPQSSSSITLRPLHSSPLLALFHHFAVRPPSLTRQLLCDLLQVTQLLYKLPSHLLTGVWGHFCKFVSHSAGNKTLHLDSKSPLNVSYS